MSKLIKLTDAEIEMVMRADDWLGPYAYSSKSQRWYTVARNRARNNDIVLILCGVRNNNAGVAECRPIGITSIDSEKFYCTTECDALISYYGVFRNARVKLYFDGDRKKTSWWGEKVSAMFSFIWKRPLNINEVIAANPRFRYCALPKWGTDTIEWLKKYSICPEIENFAKAGLVRLANVKFIESLKANKAFFRFFLANIPAIRERYYSPRIIKYAFRHTLTLDQARHKFEMDGIVIGLKKEIIGSGYDAPNIRCDNMPLKFDWRALYGYLKKTNISTYEYRRYAKYCIDSGADLTDPNTAFPHNLENRLKRFDAAKQAMELRECDKKLAELSCKYTTALSELRSNKFIAIIPSKSSQFVIEGKQMCNCIGGGNYALNMAAETCVCVFIRMADSPDTPFVDCEIVDGVVQQCYARYNMDTTREVKRFAQRIASMLFNKAA